MSEEQNKPDYGAISWRIGTERKQQLIEKFGSASGSDVCREVMDTYFKKYPELQEGFDWLKKKSDEQLEQIKSLSAEVEELKASAEASFSAEVEKATQTINDLQTQLNECGQKLTAKDLELDSMRETMTANANDPCVISVRVDNEIERKFLQAVKEHLQARYNREVSFYEIFVKSALLYNVEKRCDWFYPPLKDKAIEEATGLPIGTWKKFLTQKESK